MKTPAAILSSLIAALALSAQAQTTTNITGVISVYPNLTHSISSAVSHASATESMNRLVNDQIEFGKSNYQMNAWVWMSATLSNSERVVSLAACTNRFGEPVAFTNICFLGVKSYTGNVANITVGGIADHAEVFGDTNDVAIVRPGGLLLFYAPQSATTNGNVGYGCTSKVVRVATVGTNQLFELYIGGHQ